MHRLLRPLLPAVSSSSVSGASRGSKETGPNALRETNRACDHCRTGKIRCDGPEQPERRCTTCTKRRKACTYTDQTQRRAEPSKEYVRKLEERLAKVEHLVRKQRPDVDLLRELGALTLAADDVDAAPNSTDDASSDAEDVLTNFYSARELEGSSQAISGSSSIFPLIRTAIDSSAELGSSSATEGVWATRFKALRPEFWQPPYYEARMNDLGTRTSSNHPPLLLPPEEIMRPLIARFFKEHNSFYPLLHRRLFEQQLASDTRSEQFKAVVLMVCASGAQLGMNPQAEQAGQPPGWSYFEQVIHLLNIPVFATAQLEEAKCLLFLAFVYLSTKIRFSTPWTIFHAALRMVIQVGAHRAKFYQKEPNLVDELWKRAFWVLAVADRHLMHSMGHSPAIHEDSFDVEPILEVDDECWDLSNSVAGYPLKDMQPQNKPSPIAYFNCHAKLQLMTGTTIRFIYSINRSRVLMGFLGDEWEQRVVSKLDRLLEQWDRSVPNHLRWDPNNLNEWTAQSAALRILYYQAQINIHNPFSLTRTSPSQSDTASKHASHASVDAITLCTTAAHNSAAIFATQLANDMPIAVPQLGCAFQSALVLIVNAWGTRTGRLNTGSHSVEELDRVVQDIKTCMDVVKQLELSRGTTTRSWNILNDLASLPDEQLEQVDRTGSSIPDSDLHQAHLDHDSSPRHEPGSGPWALPPGPAAAPPASTGFWGLPGDLPQDLQMLFPNGSFEIPLWASDLRSGS